jgi:hypothetical protein
LCAVLTGAAILPGAHVKLARPFRAASRPVASRRRTSSEIGTTRLAGRIRRTKLHHRVSVDRERVIRRQSRPYHFGNRLALLQERQDKAQPMFCIESG